MIVNYEKIITDRVKSHLYDLSYEKYCDLYSSACHDFEIRILEIKLKELAIICNECDIKVPEEYTGYNNYVLDTKDYDFEHFDSVDDGLCASV